MRSRSERVGLAGVLEQLDRQARSLPEGLATGAHGFGWDAADADSRAWWPQGLTTSANGRVLLSAWYAKGRGDEHVATRVSVVDLTADGSSPHYAHVQLVEGGGRPVQVHAGGLAWCRSRLLVADTRRGIRVFDLREVERTGDGAFALPQNGSWAPSAWADSRPLRWSFLSLDNTVPEELSLVAGEYDQRGAGARLARWAADPETGLPVTNEPEEIVPVDIPSMQGAVRVDGTYVVASSAGRRRRGHLWSGRVGSGFRQHSRALPVGPEDLTYDRVAGRLWTQTEYPGRRAVLSLPLPSL